MPNKCSPIFFPLQEAENTLRMMQHALQEEEERDLTKSSCETTWWSKAIVTQSKPRLWSHTLVFCSERRWFWHGRSRGRRLRQRHGRLSTFQATAHTKRHPGRYTHKEKQCPFYDLWLVCWKKIAKTTISHYCSAFCDSDWFHVCSSQNKMLYSLKHINLI